MTLCPHCLREVRPAPFTAAGRWGALRTCPACQAPISPVYARDEASCPLLSCALIGGPGRGADWLSRLLGELEHLGRDWPTFSYLPLGEESLRRVRDLQRRPAAARPEAQAPVLIRLGGAAPFGRRLLVMHDLTGDARAGGEFWRRRDGLALRCGALVWFIDRDRPADAVDALTCYEQEWRAAGATIGRQKLVLALTATATEAAGLDDPTALAADAWPVLESLSAALEGWLEQTPFQLFICLAREAFAEVRCCPAALPGPTARDDRPSLPPRADAAPAPLYWLQRLLTPSVILEAGARREVLFSLAEAVRTAPPHARLWLSAGSHVLDAPLRIHRPLQLIGAGAAETQIVGAAAGVVLCYEGTGPCGVQHLTMRHTGNAPADVVQVVAGEADFLHCVFTGAVADPGASLVGCGLAIRGRARGSAAECEFRDNGSCGFLAADLARMEVRAGVARGNRWGIYFTDAATGTVRGNRCSANRACGVVVDGRARPHLEDNLCEQSEGYGLFLGRHAEPHLQVNRFEGNTCGDVNDHRPWLRL